MKGGKKDDKKAKDDKKKPVKGGKPGNVPEE